MTEAEIITIMRDHLEGLFPKVCPNCQRRFGTLREYLLTTENVGSTVPYDVELGDWYPMNPVGTATYANCACGSTLALSSDGMPLVHLWRVLSWARTETRRREMTPRALLNHLRDEISKQVLAGEEPG